MGSCCTCQRIERFDGFVAEVAPGQRGGGGVYMEVGGPDVIEGDFGARVRLAGSSKYVSMFTQQGRKGTNQDAMTVWEEFMGDKDSFFCGVFDGHGPSGHKVAQYARDKLPSILSKAAKQTYKNAKHTKDEDFSSTWKPTFLKSFKDMDHDLQYKPTIDSFSSGTTTVAIVKHGNDLIIANMGDSRAILCSRDDRDELIPVQLTVDLKPGVPSERERIESHGGRVLALAEEPTVLRVWLPDQDCPGLAMARAFGDFCLKNYGLISTPDVTHRKLTAKDEFVVLATDGVWDVLSNKEVIQIVASARKRSMAAQTLVEHAVQAWRYRYPKAKIDDCAVVILFFKRQGPTLPNSMSEQADLSLNYSTLPKSAPPNNIATEDGLETVLDCDLTIEEGMAGTDSRVKSLPLSGGMKRRKQYEYVDS